MSSESSTETTLTTDAQQQARAWLFLNNLALALAPRLEPKKLQQLYAVLKEVHKNIEDYSNFTVEKLKQLCVYSSQQQEDDSFPFRLHLDNSRKFVTSHPAIANFMKIYSLDLLKSGVKPTDTLSRDMTLAKRIGNLCALSDSELMRAANALQQSQFVYTSDDRSIKVLQENKVRVEQSKAFKNFDGVYVVESLSNALSNDIKLEPGQKNEALVEWFINGTRDLGDGTGRPISVVMGLDHKVNSGGFDSYFKQLKEREKKKRREAGYVATVGLKKTVVERFAENGTMASFSKRNKDNYDPNFAAISPDETHTYSVEEVREDGKFNEGTGTLFFTQYKLPAGKSVDLPHLKQFWLLSKTQHVAIALTDLQDKQQRAEAAKIILTMKLLDHWVSSGWEFNIEKHGQQIAELLSNNPKCLQAIKESTMVVDQTIKDICKNAFDVYKETPFFGKDLTAAVNVSALINHKYAKTYMGKKQGTPIQEYIDSKDQNSENTRANAKAKHQAKFTDEAYHKRNTPPVDKKDRIRQAQQFFDVAVDSSNHKMSLRQAVEFALYLQALLVDPVLYVERKMGMTKAQGEAIGSIKKTYDMLILAIAHTLGNDKVTAKSLEKSMKKFSSKVLVLQSYLPKSIQKQQLEDQVFDSVDFDALFAGVKKDLDDNDDESEEIETTLLTDDNKHDDNDAADDVDNKKTPPVSTVETTAAILSTVLTEEPKIAVQPHRPDDNNATTSKSKQSRWRIYSQQYSQQCSQMPKPAAVIVSTADLNKELRSIDRSAATNVAASLSTVVGPSDDSGEHQSDNATVNN